MFTEQQLRVIEYCAEEVKRQGDTPNHVYHMLNAWNYANTWQEFGNWDRDKGPQITLDFIAEIGKFVSPEYNATEYNPKGFRTIPIGVGNAFEWHEKAQWERIPELLEALIASYYEGMFDPTPRPERYTLYNGGVSKTAEDVFYYEFEQIHPFRDGNGRTGKILYNYLSGTLDNPIWPPNFWGVSNP